LERMVNGVTVSSVVGDPLGTVTHLASTAGVVQAAYVSDPWGTQRSVNVTDPGVASNPMRYTGQYHDPVTGNVYLRARNYNPTTGAFTQTDPMPYGPGTAFESAYVYAMNSPVTLLDVSGLRATPGPQQVAPISSVDPVRDGRPEVERRAWVASAVADLKRNFRVGGACISGSAALVAAVQGAYCALTDSGGRYGEFVSVGGGAGFEVGAGGGLFVSNASSIDDIAGWAACEGIGFGAGAGEFCQFHSGGNAYVSFFGGSFLTGKAKAGGHITAVRSYRVPNHSQVGRQAVNSGRATAQAVADIVADAPTGGRRTKSKVRGFGCG
jgi:RHS repeat-associated protein